MTLTLNDYLPPEVVVENCQKGLTLRKKFNRGDEGRLWAQNLKSRFPVTMDKRNR